MKIKFAAMLLMGLMLATAFSGCTGGENDTGGTGDTGTDDGTGDTGTGDTGGIGNNQTGGNQTGGNQTIFSDNFDDNKIDPKWKTADCDEDDSTTFEEKEGVMQIFAGGRDMGDKYYISPETPGLPSNIDEYAAVYYSKVEGDFETIVKIMHQDNTHEYAKSGIMVRNDISASGSSTGYAVIGVTPGHGWQFAYDSDDNGYIGPEGGKLAGTTSFPCWVKMVKISKTFTGYYSTDGKNWQVVGNATMGSANPPQDIGMFHCAHTGSTASPIKVGNPGLAKFDDFVVFELGG